MTDLPGRIKEAVTASVRDVQPRRDLLGAVYARYRRGRLVRVAIGAAAAMVALAGALTLAAGLWQSARGPVTGRHHAHAALFPGGGRVLLASGGTLRWVYADGRTQWIRGSFDGASVTAGEILAWKYTGAGAGYYTMALDGSHQRQVLPMTWSPRLSVIQAQLSPDRSLLGYVRQDIASATWVTDTLWIENLATGRSVSAGRIAKAGFSWLDPATLIATATGNRSLIAVTASTGLRRQIVTVSDPAMVRAYERARPAAGAPAYIRADGVPATGWTGRVAVWVAAAGRRPSSAPAELILSGVRPIAAYAPPTPSELGLTWGPEGLFALQTGAGDDPGSWHTYVGTAGRGSGPHSGRLSSGVAYGQNGVVFSPGGTVLALDDGGMETLVPVPRPQCQAGHGSRCVEFQPLVFPKPGAIQAWLP